MWKGKFLDDLKENLKAIPAKIREKIETNIKKDTLTPLEFTILETIFSHKGSSGYDIIHHLNEHFAGTWKAQSGTVYPLLSNLKKNGFLIVKQVKSPLGPLKKIYQLTEAGEALLKHKVNKSFLDQVKFMENFLIELSTIYIHSFPEEQKEEQMAAVKDLIDEMLSNVTTALPASVAFKKVCPECRAQIDRDDAAFCPFCGANLIPKPTNEE